MTEKIYKVIQWSSGNVGKASIRGICNRSDLELVGLIVSDEKKNGLDAGAISGIDEIGVFDPNLIGTEDWDLWIRIGSQYDFYCISKMKSKMIA